MRCALSGSIDAAFIFAFAVVFALIEIEIEGKHGWAAKLPTARNVVGHLTLYHVYMVSLAILVVSGFVYFRERQPCSTVVQKQQQQQQQSSLYMVAKIAVHVILYLLLQDFLWFVLNPHYTLTGYQSEAIGWHGGWLGGLPLFNFVGLGVVVTVLFIARKQELWGAFATYIALLLGVCATSPLYHIFYNWIH